jgi:hypothetical protein
MGELAIVARRPSSGLNHAVLIESGESFEALAARREIEQAPV